MYDGTCESHGGAPITILANCVYAASQFPSVNVTSTVTGSYIGSVEPPWCSYRINDGGLKFWGPDNEGNVASGQCDAWGGIQPCLCWAVAAPAPPPSPPPLPVTPTGGFHPEPVTSGTCASHGLAPILTLAECEHAAVQVGVPDTTAETAQATGTGTEYRPMHCSFKEDYDFSWLNLLFYPPDLQAAVSWQVLRCGSTACCSTTYKCLCYATAPPSAPPSAPPPSPPPPPPSPPPPSPPSAPSAPPSPPPPPPPSPPPPSPPTPPSPPAPSPPPSPPPPPLPPLPPPPPPCGCSSVRVTGGEPVAPDSMGVFDYVPGVTSGGKPVYKKEAPTTEYLFYWPEAGYEHWLIGPSYTENSASVHSGGNGTECPTAETSWSVYSLTGCPFWCTGYEISVTCASDPPPAHTCTTTALTIAGAENIQGGYMGTYEKLAIAGTVYNDGKPVFYKADPVGGPSFIFYKAHCVDSTFCGNFGSYTNDGQCDDGGAGASGAYCDLGTDCTDCGPRGEWMVGPDYADTSQAFYIYSDAACPPESGWSMWLASNNDYTMAYVVSVLADPDPPFTACACKQVLVSGADAVAPNLMGTYTWLPGVSADSNTCNSQGRPVYYNAAAGKYLHYCPGSDGNDWYISNDYATLWDNVDSASSWGSLSATCPSGSTDWRVSLTKPVCTSKTDCPCGAAVGNADAAKAACAACGYNGYDYTNDGINGIYQYQCSDQGVTLDTIYEVSGAAYIQYWTESGEYPFTFTCAPDPPPPPPPALPPGVLSSPPPPPPPTPTRAHAATPIHSWTRPFTTTLRALRPFASSAIAFGPASSSRAISPRSTPRRSGPASARSSAACAMPAAKSSWPPRREVSGSTSTSCLLGSPRSKGRR